MSDERGKVVRFTRYEQVPDPMGEGEIPPHFYGQSISDMLYEYATRPLPACWDIKSPPLSRWERFKLRLNEWVPRVHFGPCDHSDCYD